MRFILFYQGAIAKLSLEYPFLYVSSRRWDTPDQCRVKGLSFGCLGIMGYDECGFLVLVMSLRLAPTIGQSQNPLL